MACPSNDSAASSSPTTGEARGGARGGPGMPDPLLHQLALESLDVGVVVEDRNLRVEYVNSQAMSLLGIAVNECLWHTTADRQWDVIAPDGTSVPADAHPARRARRTGQAVAGAMLGVRRADGPERVWIQANAVPQVGADGIVDRVVLSFTDVTAKGRAIEVRRHRERREALGAMAGGIAHNFNNMLAVILPNVQLARESATGEAVQHLADAERAARSASDLVKHLLALGREESRSDTPVDLVPIVREALRVCRHSFDHRIQLSEEIALREAWVRANPGSMQQVVLTLLLNARDAMVATAQPVLRVRLAKAEGAGASPTVCLTVEDTGCGMSPETLCRLGEPFFTTKASEQGTGLGLASSFRSIAASGGAWRVHSEPGQGTTFTVELPLATVAPLSIAESERRAP